MLDIADWQKSFRYIAILQNLVMQNDNIVSNSTDLDKQLVGVKLDNYGNQVVCLSNGLELFKSQCVVVDTPKGKFLGTVAAVNVSKKQLGESLSHVLRVASADDLALNKDNIAKVEDTKLVFVQLADKFGLDIKFLDVTFSLDKSRLVFYFSSKDRVDFRELVKELAKRFSVYIDLRQVAEKKNNKDLALMGLCGRECCCTRGADRHATFKMVKNQNLSLNPNQTLGVCGEVKCCMAFENDTYLDINRKCTKVGGGCCSSSGRCGCVARINYLKETALVKHETGDGIEFVEYPIDDLKSV